MRYTYKHDGFGPGLHAGAHILNKAGKASCGRVLDISWRVSPHRIEGIGVCAECRALNQHRIKTEYEQRLLDAWNDSSALTMNI